ncbi:MAG TPA: hypothetical protein ENN02_02515 [Halothiobacillus sp.]|nr:hypothetical protein [Halothiobacillus sp.]
MKESREGLIEGHQTKLDIRCSRARSGGGVGRATAGKASRQGQRGLKAVDYLCAWSIVSYQRQRMKNLGWVFRDFEGGVCSKSGWKAGLGAKGDKTAKEHSQRMLVERQATDAA